MNTFAHIVFWIWIIGGQFLMFAIPFYLVFKGRSFKYGVFLTWGLFILFFAISSIPFYEFIWRFAPELIDNVSEGNSIVAALLLGWFPGIVISLFAQLFRRLIAYIKGKHQDG